MKSNTQKEDTELISLDIDADIVEMVLLEALKRDTTSDAIINRALEMEFLKDKPYPKATAEERLKLQSDLAKLND